MHGTRTDRYLFLFEQILLITKRKENGYSCKATLMVRDRMSLKLQGPEYCIKILVVSFLSIKHKNSLTLVVRKVDNAIFWINIYPVDSAVRFVNT